MAQEIHLFTLVSPQGDRHKVFYWDSYGVVCPTLATTNGNYRFLVYCVHDRYSVEAGEISPPDSTEWGLLDSIRPWLSQKKGRDLPRLPMASWS